MPVMGMSLSGLSGQLAMGKTPFGMFPPQWPRPLLTALPSPPPALAAASTAAAVPASDDSASAKDHRPASGPRSTKPTPDGLAGGGGECLDADDDPLDTEVLTLGNRKRHKKLTTRAHDKMEGE